MSKTILLVDDDPDFLEQNRLLLELALPRLQATGFRPVVHRLVPANDGGVSLGQAYVAHFTAADTR